jgi:hemerythrin superfamily protein
MPQGHIRADDPTRRRAGQAITQGVGMDATMLLRNDHQAVDRLISQLAETSAEDVQYRRLIFRLIKNELEAHSRVEEEVFYPAVMRLRSAQARESVRAALEEHQALDGLLAEMDQLEPDDPQFAARLTALRQSVDRHVLAEEGALFSEARIHLTDERLEALGRQMEMRKRDNAVVPSSDPLEPVGSRASSGPGASEPARRAVRDR